MGLGRGSVVRVVQPAGFGGRVLRCGQRLLALDAGTIRAVRGTLLEVGAARASRDQAPDVCTARASRDAAPDADTIQTLRATLLETG